LPLSISFQFLPELRDVTADERFLVDKVVEPRGLFEDVPLGETSRTSTPKLPRESATLGR
jgi:hypothetical protein